MTLTYISEIIHNGAGWCPMSSRVMREPFTSLKISESKKNSPDDGKGNTIVPSWLQDGSILVALTSAACLLILCIVLKHVLLIPQQQLNNDIIIWIMLFMGFGISESVMKKQISSEKKCLRPLIWCMLIVTTMLGVIGIYAF
ncbi:hypothetical protein [uncultured Methanospirillum sp.]|uniref:hypothetical protein n=1 Tax=uncultured Methanospirillum sp. TaxID=262503 RepID=UPI0029C67AB5|nr:hypothetical protein [uncultured Methanospirillum sp.]